MMKNEIIICPNTALEPAVKQALFLMLIKPISAKGEVNDGKIM